MGSIADMSKAYEAPRTKNIADLEKVNTHLELKEETYQDKEGKDFTIKTFEFEGEKYRMPNSVLASLKEILEEKPNLLHFKVKRSGEGLATTYTVIPLE